MAKLAYAPDLGSGGAIRAGSTPVTRTSGEPPRAVSRLSFSGTRIVFPRMKAICFVQAAHSKVRLFGLFFFCISLLLPWYQVMGRKTCISCVCLKVRCQDILNYVIINPILSTNSITITSKIVKSTIIKMRTIIILFKK